MPKGRATGISFNWNYQNTTGWTPVDLLKPCVPSIHPYLLVFTYVRNKNHRSISFILSLLSTWKLTPWRWNKNLGVGSMKFVSWTIRIWTQGIRYWCNSGLYPLLLGIGCGVGIWYWWKARVISAVIGDWPWSQYAEGDFKADVEIWKFKGWDLLGKFPTCLVRSLGKGSAYRMPRSLKWRCGFYSGNSNMIGDLTKIRILCTSVA